MFDGLELIAALLDRRPVPGHEAVGQLFPSPFLVGWKHKFQHVTETPGNDMLSAIDIAVAALAGTDDLGNGAGKLGLFRDDEGDAGHWACFHKDL